MRRWISYVREVGMVGDSENVVWRSAFLCPDLLVVVTRPCTSVDAYRKECGSVREVRAIVVA